MVMAARHLPLHPAVQGVAAASPTCGDYLHLRLPAPTSMGLWEYVQVLKERHAANPRLYKRALDQTAKAVLACGVMALQHLQAHVSGAGGGGFLGACLLAGGGGGRSTVGAMG
jgi:hypothetical protein